MAPSTTAGGTLQAIAMADRFEILRTFYRVFYNERRFAEAAPLVAASFVNHHPGARGTGPEGLAADFAQHGPPPEFRLEPVRMVADGDLIWVLVRGSGVGNGGVAVDIWRFEGEQLAEHWDVFRRLDETEDADGLLARLR